MVNSFYCLISYNSWLNYFYIFVGWPDKTDNTMKIQEALVDNARIEYHDAHIQNVLKAMK